MNLCCINKKQLNCKTTSVFPYPFYERIWNRCSLGTDNLWRQRGIVLGIQSHSGIGVFPLLYSMKTQSHNFRLMSEMLDIEFRIGWQESSSRHKNKLKPNPSKTVK